MESWQAIATIIVAVVTVFGAPLAKRWINGGGDDPATVPPPRDTKTDGSTVSTSPALDAALLDAINGTFDRLQAEIARYADESRRYAHEARAAAEALERAQEALDQLRAQALQDAATIQRLRTELTSARTDLATALRVGADYEDQLDRLSVELDRARAHVQSLADGAGELAQ